ncbi:hypothetical protein Leryth_006462 [Lithospermum erythrorhizon]|uniref:Polygalacturonase n=1 Tax=Lithospermum erythrorhizon TaxID=34254 RepID=A0AAV3NPI2_LITER|nr:hypothetical protein Leryth_006462 [Lithospermum erythrorhizon]
MGRSNNFNIFVFFFVLSSVYISSIKALTKVIDIRSHGAVASPTKDCAPAMLNAFKEACALTSPSIILIPIGEFYVKQVMFQGPCKAPIGINLQGTIIAPADPSQIDAKNDWFTVRYLDNLSIFGGGSMDGQGKRSWDLKAQKQDIKLSALFSMYFVTNGDIRDIKFEQAKNTHVHLYGCKRITMTRVTVDSPDESPNTDGIKMGLTSDITIQDSTLKSGDDCVAIVRGTQRLKVTRTTCGPGHGISVGSMGMVENEEEISDIRVTNCTLTGTDNGVRLKSWKDCPKAVATNIHFEDIIMKNVSNPIIIDQEYCPAGGCEAKAPSRVKISKVAFKNIKGTSRTKVAVKLICSKREPCRDVEIGNIHLTYNGPDGEAISTCSNITPQFTGQQIPPICASSGGKGQR